MFHIQLETPAKGAPVDPLCLRIEGWVYLGRRQQDLVRLEVRTSSGENDTTIGETSRFFLRRDVNSALQIDLSEPVGFMMLACAAEAPPGKPLHITLHARLRDGSRVDLLERTLQTLPTDYRDMPYGVLLKPETTRLYHRQNIYGSGPSVPEASAETLDMVFRYLGPPPVRVLDIGCGIGAYGKPLLAAGYDWFGVEVKESDCVELRRQNLPHARVDGAGLPFADGSYNAAIAIEVLEHIEDLDGFLRETRRVAPRLIISVPNIEIIPYFFPHLAVPWHLLEADHKNFFTRWSLHATLSRHFKHVEVLSCGKAPLKTREGTPLYYHLFAIADAD